jgi:hypothetical protein
VAITFLIASAVSYGLPARNAGQPTKRRLREWNAWNCECEEFGGVQPGMGAQLPAQHRPRAVYAEELFYSLAARFSSPRAENLNRSAAQHAAQSADDDDERG